MIRREILIYVFPNISWGYDFNYLYAPLAQSNLILLGYCIVNLVVYWNGEWIEGIHIFNSLSSHLLFKLVMGSRQAVQ